MENYSIEFRLTPQFLGTIKVRCKGIEEAIKQVKESFVSKHIEIISAIRE